MATADRWQRWSSLEEVSDAYCEVMVKIKRKEKERKRKERDLKKDVNRIQIKSDK
jgi:hypothetical protein